MSTIFKKSGGFRRLYSFQFAAIVHLGTISFCRRFISWKDDPLGKTLGQMMGASRSGKQNIIEGSSSAQTSAETEIKLTNVAKASFAELAGDFEDYLASRGEVPWSVCAKEHQVLLEIQLEPFEHTEDLLHDFWTHLLREKRKFDPWIEHDSDRVCANALLVLTMRTIGLLGRQLKTQESEFLEEGGIRERMTRARLERHDRDVPACPDCGQPMRQRQSKQGAFWGCPGYPECHGSRRIVEP